MKAILFSFFMALFALPLANAEVLLHVGDEPNIWSFEMCDGVWHISHVDDGRDCVEAWFDGVFEGETCKD